MKQIETTTSGYDPERPGNAFDPTLEKGGIARAAEISKCGLYRYWLTRRWTGGGRGVTWIMLNPSTADADQDDPTIRKCIGFSKRWGFSSLCVLNLYNLRATNPKDLARSPRRRRSLNGVWFLHEDAIVAWGRFPSVDCRRHAEPQIEFLRLFAEEDGLRLRSLGRNKDGTPRHPLMLAYSTPLEVWP